MSALVMGLVWELPKTGEFGRAEKIVLLAYADHADSNGRNIFPSVDLIARKTFYEERAVQLTTRKLETGGYLIPDGTGPRGTNRWRIPIQTTLDGGAKIAPAQNTGVKNAPEEIAPEGNAPEPSVVVLKPSMVVVNAGDVFKIYESEIGALTPIIADAIKDACDVYPVDWIPEAITIAVQKNVRNWSYVEGILRKCKTAGKRPSLNKLENKHGTSNRTSNSRNAGSKAPKPAGEQQPTDADRATAARVKARQRQREQQAGVR